MRKALFALLGGVLAGAICIGLAYVAGWLFGPLYRGEDESSRNFVIFLWTFLGFVVAGAIIGYRLGRPSSDRKGEARVH